MRFYVAGKIKAYDWRLSLSVDEPGRWGTRGVEADYSDAGSRFDQGFPVQPFSKHSGLLGHHYTGPYFVRCDHACYHGPGDHGVGAESSGCLGGGHISQARTARYCLQAIDRSDVVFAWLDDPSCYGTLFELGYAHAAGKPIWVAGPEPLPDLWFAQQHAARSYWGARDPVAAFTTMAKNPSLSDAALAELVRESLGLPDGASLADALDRQLRGCS